MMGFKKKKKEVTTPSKSFTNPVDFKDVRFDNGNGGIKIASGAAQVKAMMDAGLKRAK